MKAIVTGASGTLGRALTERLLGRGGHVVPWVRSDVPIDRYEAMEAFLRREAPDVVFHLAVASQPTGREGEGWLVTYEWSRELAWACRVAGVAFVFTSTALVFSNDAKGPFTVASAPDAKEGYGHEKREAERIVRSQYPDARIVRLGWQMGRDPGANTMEDFLARRWQDEGVVRASTRWLPACAFLEDTADALLQVLELPPGLYHADSNRGWTFHAIATALAASRGDGRPVLATEDFVYDQRLRDDRLVLPPLNERLPSLGA